MVRFLLVLLALSGCADSCSFTGSSAFGSTAFGQNGDNTTTAVVGIDWPVQPTISFSAWKQEGYVDNDPVPLATDFGTLGQDLEQPTAAKRPTYKAVCPVGTSGKPCFSGDGGDGLGRAVVEAAYDFLWSGDGVTVLIVGEKTSGTSPRWAATAAAGANRGYQSYDQSGTALGGIVVFGDGGALAVNVTTGSFASDETFANLYTGTDDGAAPEFSGFRALNPVATNTATYNTANKPTSSLDAFSLMAADGQAAANGLTGYLFEYAAWNTELSQVDREATIDAVVAAYGSFPQ